MTKKQRFFKLSKNRRRILNKVAYKGAVLVAGLSALSVAAFANAMYPNTLNDIRDTIPIARGIYEYVTRPYPNFDGSGSNSLRISNR